MLIIVQNLPVPMDRRVWQECGALRDAGYEVSVICPKGPGDPSYEKLDGVHVHKYAPPPATRGVVSYVVEFTYCWIRTALLAARIARRRPVHAVQACNPPETYFVLGWLFKRFGAQFVFDHHDLSPEMYVSRFGRDEGLLLRALHLLERATFRTADHVIATNESYAAVAQKRGRKSPEDVTVVRSAPDARTLAPVDPSPELRQGRPHMAVWLGIMGPQDGVDVALRAVSEYVHNLRRDDCHFALLGFGDAFDDLRTLVAELGLDDWVTFTGRVDRNGIARWLSTAHVGLVPDPRTPYADLSTHNKTMEYMAFELPIVTFDLTETRFSAGDAALVVDETPAAMARGVAALLDDPQRARAMGEAGRRRLLSELAWEHQAARYVHLYDRLLR